MLHFLRKDSDEHVVADRIGIPCLFQQGIACLDGTLFALDILFQHPNDERIPRGPLPAVGQPPVPVRFGNGCAPGFDNAGGKERGVGRLLRCVEGRSADDRFLVGPFHYLLSLPTGNTRAIHRKMPCWRVFYQLCNIGTNNFSLRSHGFHRHLV